MNKLVDRIVLVCRNSRELIVIVVWIVIRIALAAEAVSDPRVVLLQKDVGDVIRSFPGTFDSILLDVDNGPAALSTEEFYSQLDSVGAVVCAGAGVFGEGAD